MKLIIDKAALLGALSHAQSIVERKQTMPILGQVLLTADADGLAITTNNLDMQIVLRVPAEVKKPGSICAPAHGLTDVVKRMADGPVGLEIAEKKLRVTAGRSKIHLLTLPSADFPVLPEEEDAQAFALPAATLRKLIDRTRFAMHKDEKFFNLCGIFLFRADDGHVAAAATDKHRIARQLVAVEDGAPQVPGTILPGKVVARLRSLADELTGEIGFRIGTKRIVCSADGWELTAKLYEDAPYPPIEKAIPAWDVPLEIDAAELAGAIGRVAGICTGKQRVIAWSQSANLLTLSARDAEMGDAVEELPCDYAGPEHSYGFNPAYLSDQLQSVDGAIRFYSNAPMDATRVEIASDPLATFVIAQIPLAGGKA